MKTNTMIIKIKDGVKIIIVGAKIIVVGSKVLFAIKQNNKLFKKKFGNKIRKEK